LAVLFAIAAASLAAAVLILASPVNSNRAIARRHVGGITRTYCGPAWHVAVSDERTVVVDCDGAARVRIIIADVLGGVSAAATILFVKRWLRHADRTQSFRPSLS
jgi:hypothetical protein